MLEERLLVMLIKKNAEQSEMLRKRNAQKGEMLSGRIFEWDKTEMDRMLTGMDC
jgi:hypothetical protein